MVLHNKTILVEKLLKRPKLVQEHLQIIEDQVTFKNPSGFALAFAITKTRALEDAKAAYETLQSLQGDPHGNIKKVAAIERKSKLWKSGARRMSLQAVTIGSNIISDPTGIADALRQG